MGDRTYTSIRFSGTISREVAEELLEACQGEYLCSNETDKQISLLDELKDELYASECNYAQLDGPESVCRARGIPYCKTWEAGGDYGPGMTVFTGEDVHECNTMDGEPAVTRSMLVKFSTGILEYFDRFDFSAPRYPPLKIVDAEQEAA
jgi:hypothetical protein